MVLPSEMKFKRIVASELSNGSCLHITELFVIEVHFKLQ
ncbi:hypothetical protein T05_7472 [Trichinella murrelli]|uniref:Uncharacterized protein n=1 Tax=Trichinella murrelli TaxID=144512 RepID=A0A0V0SUK2_9BILA|nr:hypothetical protein T05_7472 [Trichinella murrelli]